AAAVREGRVNLPQARVIAHALAELPTRVGVEVIAQAEAHLVELAAEFDPTALARLGRKILAVVAPEVEEAEEARKLKNAEKHAAEKQRLRIRALGDGTTRISGLLPDAVAARLATYLHAFTNPRLADGAVRGSAEQQDPDETTGFGGKKSHPRRLAEAFGQLL